MSYADSFGYEWKKHRRTQVDDLEDAIKTFKYKTGLDFQDIKGKKVLDAGCGAGRFTQVVAIYGGEVTGIDLSDAAMVAKQNLRTFSNVNIIKCDINDMPVPDDYFDIIFSIGVLHHTPDTRQAFNSLCKKLKKGGKLAVWVYSSEGWKAKAFNFASGIYRKFTPYMNQDLLYSICKLAVPMYYIHKIPLLGLLSIALFPCSMHPKAEWRVLDTFDWYSPRYQWKHTYKEVTGWFEENGFVDIKRLPMPVAITGIKA